VFAVKKSPVDEVLNSKRSIQLSGSILNKTRLHKKKDLSMAISNLTNICNGV